MDGYFHAPAFYPAPCIEFFLVQKSVSGALFLFPHIEDDIRFAFDSGYAGLAGQWDHDVPSYIFGLGRQLIFCADSASFCFLLGVCTYVAAYGASLEDGCRYGRKLMGQEENGQHCWRKGEKGHEKNTCFKHGYAGGTFIYRVCWWK